MTSLKTSEVSAVLLVFLIPTVLVIAGFYLNPYPTDEFRRMVLNIPLFLGLILLGVGVLFHRKDTELGSVSTIAGWVLFAAYWAAMPAYLYFSEGGDVFNASVAIIGVYVLVYLAYHEWLSIRRDRFPSCLRWIAGSSFIAGIIYFTFDNNVFPQIKEGLIEVVAAHSAFLLNIFSNEVSRTGSVIYYETTPITIIFACTAIQSMVLFVGMIGALPGIGWRRRAIGMAVTVVPIYFLNLVRNAGVIFLVGSGLTDFNLAHNIIAKAGALITLIVLLFIVFKLLPELYDEITCLVDLSKRRGPVETVITSLWNTKKS